MSESDGLDLNGMTFFPVKSMFPKNVLTIAGALSHQIGYPINIVSYCSTFSGIDTNSGLSLLLISSSASVYKSL